MNTEKNSPNLVMEISPTEQEDRPARPENAPASLEAGAALARCYRLILMGAQQNVKEEELCQ